jgi:hypothetical protein
VSWAYSPGYVSWCPIGRYGYPVFGQFGMRGHYYGTHIDPWRGWTVMSREHYGRPTPVHRVAVDGHRLDPAARGAFTPGRPGSGPERGGPRPGASGLAIPRYAGGAGATPSRGGTGPAAPRGAGVAAPSANNAAAAPRTGGARARSDGRTRLSPDEAARVFAGNGSPTSGTAARRTFPGSPALGSTGPRTESPATTPEVTAFGSRRNPGAAVPRANAPTGSPAQFGDGSAPRFGNGAPARFGDGSPAQFGGGARARTYPRAAPAPDSPATAGGFATRSRGETRTPSAGSESGRSDWSPPPAVRQTPYFRGGSGEAGTVERRASPRAAEPGPQSAPRGTPYSRGSGGVAAAPSARPREGGGGVPAGPAVRGGGSSGSSARPAAPRYNPGSGSSQPRGGGSSSSPARRRGGSPD